MRKKVAERQGLYRPEFEHDSCGIGAVVDIQGRASRRTVDDALKIVEKLEHRAGKDADGKTGDGVGILVQVSHSFSAGRPGRPVSPCPGPGTMGWGCFSSPRTPCAGARPSGCSR